MSYLSGIIDKRSLVADDLAAIAGWLKEHKVEGMPTVHVILNCDDWEIPEAWDSAHGYKLTGMLGACVAQVWMRAPSAPEDVTDEALAKLEFAAACFEFLAAAGDTDRRQVAEAWLEWIYETKIERPQAERGAISRKMKVAGAHGARTNSGKSDELSKKIQTFWHELASTKEHNRVPLIRKKLGANPDSKNGALYSEKTIRNHLKNLGLKKNGM